MYAIQRWYDPENLTSHDGYIMSGYTSFKNKPIRIYECDPPITVAEFPDPPTGRPAINELECDDPVNWKGSQHGAVMKIDEGGNMEWYKVFGEEYGEMYNLIQAKESGDGKYIFTAGRGGNQLTGVQYRYLDALNTEQVTTLSCNDPCDFYTQFRSSRRFYIVKLDGSNNGEVEWQYTYGSIIPAVGVDAYASPGTAWDIVEASDEAVIAVGCVGDWQPASPPYSAYVKMSGFIVKIDPNTGAILKSRKILNTNGSMALLSIVKENANSFGIAYYRADGNSKIGAFKIDSDLDDITGSGFMDNEYNTDLTPTIPTMVEGYLDPTFSHSGGYKPWDIELQEYEEENYFIVGAHSFAPDEVVYDNFNDEGIILKLNADMSFHSSMSIGEVSAYDLKVGVHVMPDNSITAVSSSHRRKMSQDFIPSAFINTACNDEEIETYSASWPHGNDKWESDAIVYNFDPSFTSVRWSKLILDPMPKAYEYPGNVKKQLCMYNAVANASGEIVICGNNGLNFDDVHVIKLTQPYVGSQTYNYVPDDPSNQDPYISAIVQFGSGATNVGSNKKINGTLVIESGVTLTFLGGAVIEFTNGRIPHQPQIVIQDGGKLVIDGTAKITSIKNPLDPDCPDLGWGGIYVAEGGELEIVNGSIESAHLGVNVEAGGIFNVNKSENLLNSQLTFYNCITGVKLENHTSPINMGIKYAWFKNDKPLEFAYTDKYDTDVSGLDMFVDVRDGYNGNIKFTSCIFENLETDAFMPHGTGILGDNANITLIKGGYNQIFNGSCYIPNDAPNRFIGLNEGIHINNYAHPTKKVKVLEAEFIDVLNPIWTVVSDTSIIYKNSIIWSDNLPNYTNLDHDHKYGIFNSWGHVQKVWENEITNEIDVPFTAFFTDEGATTGVTGSSFYKNIVENTYTSNRGVAHYFDNDNQDIDIRCDEYTDLIYDWFWKAGAFEKQGNSTNHHAIQWTQGINDNLFTDNTGTLLELYFINDGVANPFFPTADDNPELMDPFGSNIAISCNAKNICDMYVQNPNPGFEDDFDSELFVLPSTEKRLHLALDQGDFSLAKELIKEISDNDKQSLFSALIKEKQSHSSNIVGSEKFNNFIQLAKDESVNPMLQSLAADYIWQYYGVKINRHPEVLLRQKKAIEEQVKKTESQPIKIYPNPAYDFITIAATFKNTIAEITISDLTGRTLQQIIPNTPDFSYNLNIGHYLNGVYIIQVKDINGKIWNGKFVKGTK
jgi:hypothetical protein